MSKYSGDAFCKQALSPENGEGALQLEIQAVGLSQTPTVTLSSSALFF